MDENQRLALEAFISTITTNKSQKKIATKFSGVDYTVIHGFSDQDGPFIIVRKGSHPVSASKPCTNCSGSGACRQCSGIGYL